MKYLTPTQEYAYIQYTERRRLGSLPRREVLRYTDNEVTETFSVHERLWLAQGKIVEREERGLKIEYVDLQNFFDFNKK